MLYICHCLDLCSSCSSVQWLLFWYPFKWELLQYHSWELHGWIAILYDTVRRETRWKQDIHEGLRSPFALRTELLRGNAHKDGRAEGLQHHVLSGRFVQQGRLWYSWKRRTCVTCQPDVRILCHYYRNLFFSFRKTVVTPRSLFCWLVALGSLLRIRSLWWGRQLTHFPLFKSNCCRGTELGIRWWRKT